MILPISSSDLSAKARRECFPRLTMHLFTFLLVLSCTGATTSGATEDQTGQTASDAQRDDPEAMYLRLFDLIDADGDGVVSLADIFDTLNLRRAEARQVKRMRALDANGDGKVTRAEAVAGIRAEIAYQTQRRLNTDADGDGEVTPIEYSLAVPDPDGIADSSGLTPLQQSAFKADDLDGNGRLTRAEIQTRLRRSYASGYWALLMAVRASRADSNRDGSLDEQEFARLMGKAVGGSFWEDVRKSLSTSWEKDGKLTVQNLQILFARMNETERIEAEKRMAVFEEQLR
jgi:Ca2+-binding EF-hand superfamily protein